MRNNFARPVTLMKPDRLVFPPAWVGHIPFAFWVVEAVRPRLFVELGTHTGNSFGAFTQAASRLSLDARFVAVDHWRGDEHAGKYAEDTYEDVKSYFSGNYPEIAELLRMDFDAATSEFEDGSIDLLHIDGFHTYEAVKHDFDRWLPKMSRRGVVLLHDTNVRERDFGVFRLMDELSERYPAFEFVHSHGLGVVQVGLEASDSVKFLMTGEVDDDGIPARDYFSTLGNALVGRAFAKILSGDDSDQLERGFGLASLRKQEFEAENAQLLKVEAQLRGELGRLTNEYGLALDELRKVSVEKDRLVEELERFRASRDALAADIPALEGMLKLAGEHLVNGSGNADEQSLFFDQEFYLASNPDVSESGMDPLGHYLLAGRSEGRLPIAAAAGDLNRATSLKNQDNSEL